MDQSSTRKQLNSHVKQLRGSNSPFEYSGIVKIVNTALKKGGVGLSPDMLNQIKTNTTKTSQHKMLMQEASLKEAPGFFRDMTDPKTPFKDKLANFVGGVVNSTIAPIHFNFQDQANLASGNLKGEAKTKLQMFNVGNLFF
ncbi:hypothetical protein [Chitiniphilus shinanonensis]|uniref:hypothetical protein n=1 Tax=Chitiniphilus shinanonensis TaxID=553088 RepID=UPI003058ACAE